MDVPLYLLYFAFFSMAVVENSFDWKVAEAAAQLGFWPDLISTDLHSGNVHGGTKGGFLSESVF